MSSSTEERDKEVKVPEVFFKGIDGNECEAFVVAIQDFAFAKGLDEDHHWMVRFAKTRLRGKALRWYATLDSSVKKDWELFVQALFDQYPLAEEPGVAEITTPVWSATTFSPAPSTVALPSNPVADRNAMGLKTSVLPTRQYDPSSTKQQLGLLRIVTEEEGASIPQYVWLGYAFDEEIMGAELYDNSYAHRKRTTFNRHEALVVSFLPSSNPHSIGCVQLKSRGVLRTLVIECDYRDAGGVGNCTLYGCTNNLHTYTTPIAQKLSYVSNIWNLLADGTLQASLSSFSRKSTASEFEENKFSTTEVHVDTSGDVIRFVKPGTSLEQDKPEGKFIHPFVRARIVFEPL